VNLNRQFFKLKSTLIDKKPPQVFNAGIMGGTSLDRDRVDGTIRPGGREIFHLSQPVPPKEYLDQIANLGKKGYKIFKNGNNSELVVRKPFVLQNREKVDQVLSKRTPSNEAKFYLLSKRNKQFVFYVTQSLYDAPQTRESLDRSCDYAFSVAITPLTKQKLVELGKRSGIRQFEYSLRWTIFGRHDNPLFQYQCETSCPDPLFTLPINPSSLTSDQIRGHRLVFDHISRNEIEDFLPNKEGLR
jgi:hypothetical protein